MAKGVNNDELALLGLTHNPFLESGDAFYPGGQRKRLLDQLSHLSQWSRRSLLVTGIAGSGKTTLCDHLSSSMEPKARSAKVSGESATSRRDVLAAAVVGFGVSAPTDANADVLDELLRAFVEEQQDTERLCVVLVDDAHRLDSRAIETLLRLSLDCKVRIVLFAEPTVSRMVEEIGANLDIACHETQLIGFGQSDVRGYLEWRFEQAGYLGQVPFTDAQVETIAKVSSGLPGRIDELAGQELGRLSTGETEEMESSFPITHRLLIGMLVVVFGLLYLLVSGGDDELDEVPSAELATVQADSGVIEQAELPLANAPMLPAAEPTEGESRPNSTPLPTPDGNSEATVPLPALPTEAVKPSGGQTATQLAAQKIEAAERAAAREAAAAKERAAATKRAAAEKLAAAQTKAAADAKAAAELAAQRQQAQAKAAEQVSSSTGAKSARWLLQQDPQHYTLQLFTLSTAAAANRYVSDQSDQGEFALYQFDRAGKTFFVVTYGLFSSRAAASAASARLPSRMRVSKPWIRPLAQVQETIRANL